MGITDIFEPSRADFSPMTVEAGIYAKHIEQTVALNIRTHTNNNLRSKLGETQEKGEGEGEERLY